METDEKAGLGRPESEYTGSIQESNMEILAEKREMSRRIFGEVGCHN